MKKLLHNLLILMLCLSGLAANEAYADDSHECHGVIYDKAIDSEAALRDLLEHGGNGYLTADLTIEEISSQAASDIKLCLNGHIV